MVFFFQLFCQRRAVLQHPVSTDCKYLGGENVCFFLIHNAKITLMTAAGHAPRMEGVHREQMLDINNLEMEKLTDFAQTLLSGLSR